jgi:HD-like signal output (HDOD) protein
MLSAGHEEIAGATAEALHDAATQQRYSPRRPNMLPRLLSAANDESVSRRELSSIITRDPSLVGSLLKIANSSFYRISPDPVESVDRAVILLGTDGIRSLITAALMQPIFRVDGTSFPRFPEIAWEHTFRSASAAVPYSIIVEKSDPFASELLSLVMGLAGIVVFRVVMDQYTKDLRLRPDAGVIASLLDTHSASVARRIGASWELSEQSLAGLDGQTMGATTYATPLGRSLYFGRLMAALAVLRINGAIDDASAQLSIPATTMPPIQLERMWGRLTAQTEKG